MISTIFFFMAFFLAQAIFFEAAVPFFLPLWVIVRSRYEHFKIMVLAGGVLGAFMMGTGQAVLLGAELIVLESIMRFRYVRVPSSVAMVLSMMSVQAIWQTISYDGIPPSLVQLYVFSELFFAVILLLFMQKMSVPIHEFHTKKWTIEQTVAGLIVVSILITGMQSITLYYFALPIIALHLLICIAGIVGGVAASVIVAVVVGLFVSLAEMSFTGMLALYALTGIVVGVTQKMGRLAVAIGSILPSVFFFLYDATLPLDSIYFVSILTATICLMLVPASLIEKAQDYFTFHTTETNEQEIEKTALATNHMLQFQQFVYFMKDLVFDRFTTDGYAHVDKRIEPLSICASCFRFEHCWGGSADMERTVEQWLMMKKSSKPLEMVRAEEQLKMKCVKSSKLLEELESKLHKEHMNGQFYHGKKMIALQLRDLSHHLEQLLDDRNNGDVVYATERHIRTHLQQGGINCFEITWINNAVGERDLLCSVVDERDTYTVMRQMELILSELLNEPLKGQQVVDLSEPFSYVQISFQSAVRYQLEYDIYKRTQQSVRVSGDSHVVFPVHAGLTAIMLSDGMGNNERAQRESTRLIQMMRDCLNYNMDPETAMHTMHYVLSLKNDSDMYATIDFALVDLQVGTLWCWKAGGMTTYILRGPELFKIESKTAPIGFMPVFTIDTETIQLLAEDVIIMVSDGLFTSTDNWARQENLFLQLIRQGIRKGSSINVVLYDVMAQYKQQYETNDDCTVMLFQLTHVNPEWSVFRPASS